MGVNIENYLTLILGQDCQTEILTSEEINNIQIKLWSLLGKRVERFTMGDSSSVPVETAEELFKSICFSINMYLKAENRSLFLLKDKDLECLLKAGWSKIESEIERGKELLNEVEDTSLPIENISYNDTLHEIGSFFKKYDYRFFSHEIPCSIDYQLCQPVSEDLYGIEYINEYLTRLLIENKFCKMFDINKIKMLLQSYCPDYKELLINIYEPIVTNAIGLVLLEGDIYSLDISGSGRTRLFDMFCTLSEAESVSLLCQASEKLCYCLQISDSSDKEYLKTVALNVYPRIAAALPTNQLEEIFLSLYKSKQTPTAQVQFIDDKMMDNEHLRVFIDELNSCRYITDKIAMFESEVHSLSDCIEILNTCFWDNECTELFNVLGKTRLALLLNYIYQKRSQSPHWESETGWEQQLIKYLQE